MKRREYKVDITFNETKITKVIIDNHYKEKHSTSISDKIIIELVEQLDGQMVEPKEVKPPFSYFAEELRLHGKRYRLIWLIEEDQIFIGVVNAYRR